MNDKNYIDFVNSTILTVENTAVECTHYNQYISLKSKLKAAHYKVSESYSVQPIFKNLYNRIFECIYTLSTEFETSSIQEKDTATHKISELTAQIEHYHDFLVTVFNELRNHQEIKERLLVEAQSLSDKLFYEISGISKIVPEKFRINSIRIPISDVGISDASNILQTLYEDLIAKSDSLNKVTLSYKPTLNPEISLKMKPIEKIDEAIQAELIDKDLANKINNEETKSMLSKANTNILDLENKTKEIAFNMEHHKSSTYNFLSIHLGKLNVMKTIHVKLSDLVSEIEGPPSLNEYIMQLIKIDSIIKTEVESFLKPLSKPENQRQATKLNSLRALFSAREKSSNPSRNSSTQKCQSHARSISQSRCVSRNKISPVHSQTKTTIPAHSLSSTPLHTRHLIGDIDQKSLIVLGKQKSKPAESSIKKFMIDASSKTFLGSGANKKVIFCKMHTNK